MYSQTGVTYIFGRQGFSGEGKTGYGSPTKSPHPQKVVNHDNNGGKDGPPLGISLGYLG